MAGMFSRSLMREWGEVKHIPVDTRLSLRSSSTHRPWSHLVLLNRSPSRASCCYQAAGMVERYHWIILGVNQENRWRYRARRAQRLLDGMLTDRMIRARNQRTARARAK